MSNAIRPINHTAPYVRFDRTLREHNDERHSIIRTTPHPPERCEVMRDLLALITDLGPVDEPILVWGESAPGRLLVAQAIHESSPRCQASFVVVDCRAFLGSLDVELFGRPGVIERRPGAIEIADGGTLFIDEVSAAPLAVQAKLLDALESRLMVHDGDTAPQFPVDVRFIFGTGSGLSAQVSRGEVRSDLYRMMSTISVVVPPLGRGSNRENGNDEP